MAHLDGFWRAHAEEREGASFIETSRKDDHMPWPPRRIESSRTCALLALAKKASRWWPCSPLLSYLLDTRFYLFIM